MYHNFSWEKIHIVYEVEVLERVKESLQIYIRNTPKSEKLDVSLKKQEEIVK